MAALLAGCAARAPAPGSFVFGVMGDVPYNEREEPHVDAMLERMGREPLAFIVHIGDIKAGSAPCTRAVFEKRRAQLDRSRHAIVYTPGDNEWSDCRRGAGGDPLESLANLRGVFFSDRWSLGAAKIETMMQEDGAVPCGAYPENRAWTYAGVRFVTLNVPGSDNNLGFDKASDDEAACRNEANRRWLARAVDASEAAETRALVVAIHANPWVTLKPAPYRDLLAQIRTLGRRLRKPVLFVHGDTHIYRVDTPFSDAGGTVFNLTRLETYGSPFVGWVKVTVDPESPGLFRFEPMMERLVPPL